MSWEFLLTALIVVVSPGTGVLYTLATGLSRGSKASLAVASAVSGVLPHAPCPVTVFPASAAVAAEESGSAAA